MFGTVERTIVDWCEANGLDVSHEGDQFFVDAGDVLVSLTELANAVAGAIGRAVPIVDNSTGKNTA